ncbi:MAG: hypothetical protein ACOYNS_00065 [Bacteroidota bacterium]
MKTFALATLAIFFGCAVALPEPTEEDLRRFRQSDSTLTLQSISDARTMYVRKCSGCHSLYLPGSFKRDQWKEIVRVMGQRAKIGPSDESMIMRYLTLYSSAAIGPISDSVHTKTHNSNAEK